MSKPPTAPFKLGVPVIVTLLVLAVFVPSALAISRTPGHPTVSDQRQTLDLEDLSQVVATRISGIRDITVRTGYNGDQSSGELLECPARFRYTHDGSNPGPSSPVINMPCTEAGGNDVPMPDHVYEVTIKKEQWATAPPNALIKFQFEVDFATPQGRAPHIDNNGGTYFKFRLDKSAGAIVASTPGTPAGSSTKVAATQNDKPPLSFTLQDEQQESPINQSTVRIDVNGVDRTSQFDCTYPNVHTLTCTFSYARAGAGFNFTQNQVHSVVVTGQDEVGNPFDAAKSTLQFRVDRKAPVVTDVKAVPNQSTPGGSGGLPITARGVNVTVEATVTDDSMNLNSASSVFAQLYNTTRGVESPLTAMSHNATSKKWESKSVRIPDTWPQQEFRVSARVIALDLAANSGSGNTTKEAFVLDPVPPLVNDVPVGTHVKDVPVVIRAEIKDQGSGLDPPSVVVRYSNQTGKFKAAPPAAHTKINSNTFEVKMTQQGTSSNYTAEIPAAENNAVIRYTVMAKDRAGGLTRTENRTYTVDLNGPNVTEIAPKAFRGKAPYVFQFNIVDTGVGVNKTTARLFHSTGGAFSNVALNNTAGTTYEATINVTAPDGGALRYYVEVLDLLGNKGNLSSQASPKESKIDLSAPTFTITAPATANTATFQLNWSATDSGSGVDTYTVEARVLGSGGTPSAWITIFNKTTLKTLDFCGEGNRTYQFRGFATDKAGNSGTLPASHQAQTVLSGAGCAEGITVRLNAPRTGETITGSASSRTYNVAYLATSTRSFTPALSLIVTIEFSPDGGQHWFELDKVQNSGTYPLDLDDVPNCSRCMFRLTAESLSGSQGQTTSGQFQLRGASPTVDLDENGLADSWELSFGTTLGELSPEDDEDGDGLSNQEESAIGTDPTSKDTDGDGVNDQIEVNSGTDPRSAVSRPTDVQARSQQYTNWYWSIPALFGATSIVFFAGLARRW